MQSFLNLLHGKKTTIMAILCLTVQFGEIQHWIDQATATYIHGVLVVLAGGANLKTHQLKKKNESPQ